MNTEAIEKMIHEDERLDDLQLGELQVLQKQHGFRYGMDAVLLSDFIRVHPGDHVADFGTGTGILPLLLHGRGKGACFHAFEIQPDMAEMAARTMQINQLQETIFVHCCSVTAAESIVGAGKIDAIICNPPYGTPSTTLKNPSRTLRLARHQDDDGLLSWFKSAHRILKGKGRIAVIYPAPRMLEIMECMEEAHLVPKRFRLIYPSIDKPANLVLIEALKDAKPMLHPEPPLIIYQQNGLPTDELRRIYHQSIKDSTEQQQN